MMAIVYQERQKDKRGDFKLNFGVCVLGELGST